MTIIERAEKIDLYGRAPVLLSGAIEKMPKDAMYFKPSPEKWSAHEILIHLADSEANSFIRCRRAVAESGKSVMAYDQDAWAVTLNYAAQSAEDALNLFTLLRRTTHTLLKTLPETVWTNTIEHPENGTMTLDDWLNVYAKHVPDHIAQMHANTEHWKRATGKLS